MMSRLVWTVVLVIALVAVAPAAAADPLPVPEPLDPSSPSNGSSPEEEGALYKALRQAMEEHVPIHPIDDACIHVSEGRYAPVLTRPANVTVEETGSEHVVTVWAATHYARAIVDKACLAS